MAHVTDTTDDACLGGAFFSRHRKLMVQREETLGKGWFIRHWIQEVSSPQLDPDTNLELIQCSCLAQYNMGQAETVFALPHDMLRFYRALFCEEAWDVGPTVSPEQWQGALAAWPVWSRYLSRAPVVGQVLFGRNIVRQLVLRERISELRDWYLASATPGSVLRKVLWKMAVWTENHEAVDTLLDASASATEPVWSDSWACEIGLMRRDGDEILDAIWETAPKSFVTDHAWNILDKLVSRGRIDPKAGENFEPYRNDLQTLFGRNVTTTEIQSLSKDDLLQRFEFALTSGNGWYAYQMFRAVDAGRQRELATMNNSVSLVIAVALGDRILARALFKAGASPDHYTEKTTWFYDDRHGPCDWCPEVQDCISWWGWPSRVIDVPRRVLDFAAMKRKWEHRLPLALWAVASLRERRKRTKRQRETFECE